MKNIFFIFLSFLCVACVVDKTIKPQQADSKKFVLAEYGWKHRPGTGENGFSQWLTATDGWIKIPNPEDDGIYSLKHYFVETFSHKQCEERLVVELQSDKFRDSGDCASSKSHTCFTTNGNTVTGVGYLETYSEFHCIPYDFWIALKPQSDDKCYNYNNPEGYPEEQQCSESMRKKNKKIYKSPSEYHRAIKKCTDYKSNTLFVCE